MRDLKKFPLRIGILGCGSFLEKRIFPVIQDIDTIRIVCIQNRTPTKGKEIATKYGIPHAVSKREDLLNDPMIEAVYITSPNFLHEEDALACANAIKPTLCEKPLSISAASVDRILKAFQKQSVPIFVGYQHRFNPSIQKARLLFSEKKIGELLHLRAYYFARGNFHDNWRLKKGNGGGALQEIGTHLVDLIHFISGEEIISIQAVTMPAHSSGIDRMGFIHGQLSGGAIISLECGYMLPNDPGSKDMQKNNLLHNYNGFEIFGTKAFISCPGHLRSVQNRILYLTDDDGKKISFPLPTVNFYVEELKHFAKAIVEGSPSPIAAELSRINQKVIDFAYESAEKEAFSGTL